MLMSDEASRNACLGIPAETPASASQRVFHPLVLPGHPCCPNVVGWGWRVMRGEPVSDMGRERFQLEGPTEALSVREFQGSGRLGLMGLPRKTTSNTSRVCCVISLVLRAQLAFSHFSCKPTS